MIHLQPQLPPKSPVSRHKVRHTRNRSVHHQHQLDENLPKIPKVFEGRDSVYENAEQNGLNVNGLDTKNEEDVIKEAEEKEIIFDPPDSFRNSPEEEEIRRKVRKK